MIAGWDLRILLLVNGWFAATPGRFYAALRQAGQGAWLLGAMLLVGLWFFGERGVVAIRPGGVTQLQSRRYILLSWAALVAGFFSARLLQGVIARSRPLVDAPLRIPIDPATWNQVRSGLELQGAFPSDHAVMLFTLCTLAWSINRWAGALALSYALYFSSLRIGIGYHWPSDILAGATLAVAWTRLILSLDRWLAPVLNRVLLFFEAHPGWMYGLGFLVMYDFSNKLTFIFAVLDWLRALAGV